MSVNAVGQIASDHRCFDRDDGAPLPQAEEHGREKHRERREKDRAIKGVRRQCWQMIGQSDMVRKTSMAVAPDEVNSRSGTARLRKALDRQNDELKEMLR